MQHMNSYSTTFAAEIKLVAESPKLTDRINDDSKCCTVKKRDDEEGDRRMLKLELTYICSTFLSLQCVRLH